MTKDVFNLNNQGILKQSVKKTRVFTVFNTLFAYIETIIPNKLGLKGIACFETFIDGKIKLHGHIHS